jgi:hypothetical protein
MKDLLIAASLLLSLPVLAQTINQNIDNITPDSRYTVNNDGTVSDNETGLMWMQCAEGQTWESNGGEGNCTGSVSFYSWDTASALASDKAFAGYSDWRLPDLKELASLVAEDRYDPAINSTIFPSTPSSSFWSGSLYVSYGNLSWAVNFYYGSDIGDNRSSLRNVRLVRSEP